MARCKCWGLKKCLCVHVWKLLWNPMVSGNASDVNCFWLSKEQVGTSWDQALHGRCPHGTPSPGMLGRKGSAPLIALCAGSAAPSLFGPSLAAGVVRASLINWEVVFRLGMIHCLKTWLGEGLHNLFLIVLLIYPRVNFCFLPKSVVVCKLWSDRKKKIEQEKKINIC